VELAETSVSGDTMKQRKGMKDFWSKFKTSLIDLFREEEDHAL
jgi:cell division protein FtsA